MHRHIVYGPITGWGLIRIKQQPHIPYMYDKIASLSYARKLLDDISKKQSTFSLYIRYKLIKNKN